MPNLLHDFLSPLFWKALGIAIANGLGVLLFISALAAGFVFLTGGTAPLHWPKKDASHEPAS